MTIQRNPLSVAKDMVRYRQRPRSKKTPPQGFSPEVRRIVAARSGGVCEIGDCVAAAVHMHHRRPRGLGGTSVAWVNKAANCLHTCLDHHAYIENHRTQSMVQGLLISQHRKDAVAVDIPVLRRGVSVLLGDDGSIRPAGGEG